MLNRQTLPGKDTDQNQNDKPHPADYKNHQAFSSRRRCCSWLNRTSSNQLPGNLCLKVLKVPAYFRVRFLVAHAFKTIIVAQTSPGATFALPLNLFFTILAPRQ
jgi:hypothetical protein